MIDLKKNDSVALIQSELQELTTTNQQLQGQLQTVRSKLNGELDALTYKLEKVAYETEEIRREVRDINRTIDKLRYDLLDAVRNSKSNSLSDLFMSLTPFIIVGMSALVIVFSIVLMLTST